MWSISSTFLRTNFSYERLSAAFSSYVPALASKFRTKNARIKVDEIDTWNDDRDPMENQDEFD